MTIPSREMIMLAAVWVMVLGAGPGRGAPSPAGSAAPAPAPAAHPDAPATGASHEPEPGRREGRRGSRRDWREPPQAPLLGPEAYRDPLPAGAVARLGSRRLSHLGGTIALTVSPDGTTLVSSGNDHLTCFWQMPSGKLVFQIEHPQTVVNALVISPDASLLALGRADGILELRQSGSLKVLGSFPAGAAITSVSISTDSRVIATASQDGSVRLWTKAGPAAALPAADTKGARVVAFSPGGQHLAWAGDDGVVHVQTLGKDGRAIALPGHRGAVLSLAFTRDGTSLASGSADETIRVWDPAAGKLRHELSWPMNPVNALAYNRDGKVLVSGSGIRLLRVWRDGDHEGRNMTTDEADKGPITGLLFTPGAMEFLMSASADGTIRMWDPESRRHEVQGLDRHRDRVNSIAFSPDGAQVAMGGSDATVRTWLARNGFSMGRLVAPCIPRNAVNSVAYAPDGSFIAAGLENRDMMGFPQKPDRQGRFPMREMRAHGDEVRAVAFTPDGTKLVTGTSSGRVRIFDPSLDAPAKVASKDRRFIPELLRFPAHAVPITALRVFPDGKLVATAAGDSAIHLWDLATGARRQSFSGHVGAVHALACTPDGRELFSAGADGTIRCFDVASGKELRAFTGQTSAVLGLDLSRDGAHLAACGEDRRVRVWNAKTAMLEKSFSGHEGAVRCVAFSPDGKLLASGSDDRTGLVWSLER